MDLTVINDLARWVAVGLAFVVSLLTLYNAARLKTGMLAVSTYMAGSGMIFLAAGLFLVTSTVVWADLNVMSLTNYVLFIIGFVFLGLGAFKIYQMSRV